MESKYKFEYKYGIDKKVSISFQADDLNDVFDEFKNFLSSVGFILNKNESIGIIEDENKKIDTVVFVSGGFDPLHGGHVSYLKEAAFLAHKNNGILHVILNGDSFLQRKKGYVCIPSDEREKIIGSLFFVDEVYVFNSDKDDVIDALQYWAEIYRKDDPNITLIFAKGGDRRPDCVPIPEENFCIANGIRVVYGVGGNEKENSSSDIIKNVLKQLGK